MMDLRKLVYKLRLRYVVFKWRKLPDNKTNIDYCRDLLSILDPSRYADDRLSGVKIRQLPAIYDNIEEYTKILKQSRRALDSGGMIQVDYLYKSHGLITTMGSFFISSDRHYLDAHAALKDFKREALAYCNELDKIKDAEPGRDEYHFRILSRLTVNLQTITKQLVELSI